MKSVSEMTRLEFAAFVAAGLRERNIDVVLSGGSCVSVYGREKYVSWDLDFVNVGFVKHARIREAMESLGFTEEHRYFRHPNSVLLVEFPAGPLAVGEEPVKGIDEITTATGVVRIISPTDCVKDRLAWLYDDGDLECLEQAVLVAGNSDVDLAEIERWSSAEGKRADFDRIRHRLRRDPRSDAPPDES